MEAASPIYDIGLRVSKDLGFSRENIQSFAIYLGAGIRSEKWKTTKSHLFDAVDNSGSFWEAGFQFSKW